MSIIQEKEIREALARGYCSKQNEHKVLDADLIEDMVIEVEKLINHIGAEKIEFNPYRYAQFSDAIQTLETKNVKAITIGILDGVLYIKGGNKLYRYIVENPEKHNIMSALVLREFLYQV